MGVALPLTHVLTVTSLTPQMVLISSKKDVFGDVDAGRLS